jgi:SAM-dependent methyltransferase
MISLNIGCGETKMPDCVNIDCVENEIVKPDLICDIRREPLPYKDGEVDNIYMIHAIEHIEFYYWDQIFQEFARVLKPNGVLLLGYPEFSECAKRFVDNAGGSRVFWRKTLYGRQLYDSDYHVVPMHSPEVKEMLETYKFYRVVYQPESPQEPYNTTLVARRDPEQITREEIITRELNLDRKKMVKGALEVFGGI